MKSCQEQNLYALWKDKNAWRNKDTIVDVPKENLTNLNR